MPVKGQRLRFWAVPILLLGWYLLLGARAAYLHLAVRLPAAARGQELSALELQNMGATLQRFHIHSVKTKPAP